MGLEIERRFLVRGEGWRSHVHWRAHLHQGYLVTTADGLTLRVRCSEPEGSGGPAGPAEAWLTLKARPTEPAGSSVDGLVRQEFEYAIPPADGLALMALAPQQIRKWRHGLDLAGGDWVVDVFEAGNAPLVVAEVELPSSDQALFIPDWCALEITGRHDLSNAALAQDPLTAWSEDRLDSLPPWLVDGGQAVASDTIQRLS